MAYRQGRFKPANPSKYKGDPTNIVYRSGWELKLFQYVDRHPSIISWSSEEIVIPYRSPIDGRVHRYFPDVFVEQINMDGVRQKMLLEIKPESQTIAPTLGNKLTKAGKPTKRFIQEVQTWGVNSAKWQSAKEYCKDKGWTFHLVTEKQLFGKK